MKLMRIVRWTLVAVPLTLVLAGLVAYWRSGNSCDDRPSGPPVDPMRAVVYCDYGTAEVLTLETVEKPVPGDGQVLVRVRAAAVNPLDWHYMRGTPHLMRLETGLRKPAETRLGVDFAGTVESVGPNVTRFKPGDDVFGGRTGAFAEYVVVRDTGALVLKPANITFEQAAAVPIAAITALQALRDKGRTRPGHKVLINGASGGVGTFAVQIARHLGAEVTGVCSTRNVELVRSLGATHVVDYTREDFTTGTRRYDVILDNVANQPLRRVRGVLTSDGRYVLVGGGGPDDHRSIGPLGRVVGAFLLSRTGQQQMTMFVSGLNAPDLGVLRDLLAAGSITPVIDRTFAFDEIPEAIRYLERGRARGKVIITVATPARPPSGP
jgi:NADPH:quinone reductase-like Zn-dependent oxidoreductase